MSYGYPPPSQAITYDNTGNSNNTSKLYHPEYRPNISDTRATIHHPSVSDWPPAPRAPPPTYNSPHGGGVATYSHATPPPPPVLLPHHTGESDAHGNCLCTSCNSFNNNRPPDYPPSLPPAPSIPHHSSGHLQSSWHQQQSFSSPSHSGGVQQIDYYSTPTSINSLPYPPPPQLSSSTMTAHERNNNEPSMVSPSRYTPTGSISHNDTSKRQEIMPLDPREWSRFDVMQWIQWASAALKLRDLHVDRFHMNGKALCLMDLSMFLYRVPDGGERLYQDFQGRLQKALCQDKMR